MVTEVIYFLNEIDLLRAHLNEHLKFDWPIYVCESKTTISGVVKPLFFPEIQPEFPEVRFVEIPCSLYSGISGPTETQYKQFRDNDWRKRLWAHEKFSSHSRYIFHSDVDEILDYSMADAWLKELGAKQYYCFALKQYMGRANLLTPKTQDAYRLAATSLNETQLQTPKLCSRQLFWPDSTVGWHFTNIPCSAEEMRLKAQCRPWCFKVEHPDQVPGIDFFEEAIKDPYRNYMTNQPLTAARIVETPHAVKGVLPECSTSIERRS